MIYPLMIEVIDEICVSIKLDSGNHYETLPYIPGRVIWGALASRMGVKSGIAPSIDFMDIFYSDDVVFSNCYRSDNNENGNRSIPVPLSARTLKVAPGFIKDSEFDPKPKGIFDWLLRQPSVLVSEDYIKYEKFYSHAHQTTVSVPLSLSIHHERHKERGTTKDQGLFSRTNIQPGTVFFGFIRTSPGKENKINELMQKLGIKSGIKIKLGRQPGKVFIKHNNSIDQVFDDFITDELDPTSFTLTCYSDVILMDDFHRYLSHIPAEPIHELLSDVLASCKLSNYFSATTQVYGWNGAYCRPAETETAIAKGSAFHYDECQLKQGKTQADLVGALRMFQERGIGLRRHEGFGEIRINDDFHTVFAVTNGGVA